MFADGTFDQFMYGLFHIFRFGSFQFGIELSQSFCNSSVQYHIRVCNRCCRTKHTELKFVSGKCKW